MTYFRGLATLVAAAGFVAPTIAAAGHTLTNGTITIGFATSPTYTTANADRVDSVQWAGTTTTFSNYVTNGGPLHCNDPQEFFGQAYGDGDAHPYAVIAGTFSKWSGKGDLTGKTKVTSLTGCDATMDALTRTSYALSTKSGLLNTMKIVRTFDFKTGLQSNDLRVYVPRLPLDIYPVVYAPDVNGVVQTYNANDCGGNCSLTNWNGTWFADDDGNSNGLMILRSPAKNEPALIVIDNDSYSGSNNTAVALAAPANGWTGRYVETEYMCFYDAKSWPAAKRNAGKLPKGCSAVSIK